jgi:arylsulfatase A-like enzyme
MRAKTRLSFPPHPLPWLGTLALAAACGPGPGPRPGSQAPSVVLICLDTVRADRLTPYGHTRDTTPFLEALASRAVVFERASAASGWTKPSVPSFLTGTYPCEHGVYEGSSKDVSGSTTDLLPEASFTLAEAFQQAGYRTGAFLYNGQLREGVGFEQGFDTYHEERWDAEQLRWQGLDWLDEAQDDRPFFLYLHFLDAHWPYPVPEAYATRYAPLESVAPFYGKDSRELVDEINSGRAITAEERAGVEALYDGALSYLDDQLARLWRGLEVRGLDENTIFCVIADHGEEFGEHGRVGHGHGLWEGLLHVPWILRVPGRPAARVKTPVSLVDLFPTLVTAAGLPTPDGLAGLDRLARPDELRPVFAEHKSPDKYFQALRDGDRKLQRLFDAPSSNGEKLYPVLTGQRWEAEFDWKGGRCLATQLKPRDEDPDDAPEVKGRVRDVTAEGFTVARMPVRITPETARNHDEGTAGPELEEGLIVKVRGPVVGGVLQAERIKFYARDADDAREIRGTVQEIEHQDGAGHVVLGGFALEITPETDLKDAKSVYAKPPLSREEIADLLADPQAAALALGLEVDLSQYDLGADPGELQAQSAPPDEALRQVLDQLGTQLTKRRVFGADDRRQLTPDALQALQDIGYAGDQ